MEEMKIDPVEIRKLVKAGIQRGLLTPGPVGETYEEIRRRESAERSKARRDGFQKNPLWT